MKPLVFERSIWLPASPEAVFEFHSNPRNMLKIMPQPERIEILQSAEEAASGGKFEIRIRLPLFTLNWEGVWEVVESPHLLVDGALRSPFRFWRHEHRFDPEKGGTRMTDRVEFLPHWVPGFLAVLAVPVVLVPMFRSRHHSTLAWFEKGKGAAI